MPIKDIAAGAGLGLLIGPYNDARQLEQQRRMQALQIEGQKEMGRYNQGLALEMWEKTNYAAQRKQMEKAGLNVGLMYGQGGPGGTTQTPTGNVQGGSAQRPQELGMGIQLGLQAAMQQAQIENLKADTKLKEADATKRGGVDIEEATSRIEAIKQSIKNAQTQNDIAEYEKQIKAIESSIAQKTEQEIISQIQSATDKLEGESKSATAKGNVDEKTQNELMTQARLNTIEQQLRMTAIKAGIINTQTSTKETNAKIGKIAAEIAKIQEETKATSQGVTRENIKLSLERMKVLQDMARTEFSTSNAAQVKQWTEIFADVVKAGAAGASMMK